MGNHKGREQQICVMLLVKYMYMSCRIIQETVEL